MKNLLKRLFVGLSHIEKRIKRGENIDEEINETYQCDFNYHNIRN